jgi:four helix bundle protein
LSDVSWRADVSDEPKRLLVKDKAVDLVEELYALTAKFPSSEMYGLTSQLRRAIVSVPANIVEGQARLHQRDFVRSLSIARGSLAEVGVLVEISCRLGYLSATQVTGLQPRLDEVGRMLSGLIRSLSSEGDGPLHGR